MSRRQVAGIRVVPRNAAMLFVPDAVFDTAPGAESFFYAVVLLLTLGRGQNETTGKDGYSMKTALEAIEKKAFDELERADGLKALDAVRVKYLGKKGELTAILKQMGKLSALKSRKSWRRARFIWSRRRLTCVWQPKRWMSPSRAKNRSWEKNTR